MADTPRPTVTITATHFVHFDTPWPDFGRIPETDGTVGRFLRWGLDNEIFALRGTSSSGGGRHTGAYPAEHLPEILAWVKAEGLDVDVDDMPPTDAAGLLVVAASRLADAVEKLVQARVLDSRSPAGDAVLDLRDSLDDLREAGVAPHAFATYDVWKAEHP